MQKSVCWVVQAASATSTGNAVVTYIHTKVRNRVLPIAILERSEKYLCGIFGALYKKVAITPMLSGSQ